MQRDEVAYWRGMTWVLGAYATAFVGALLAAQAMPAHEPLWTALVADVVATLIVFGFSVAARNSSLYDPYWSVAPIAIVGYWTLFAGGEGNPIRQSLVLGAVVFWGTRLTTHWVGAWGGLDHEDWRYVRLRQRTGLAWQFVNLFGVHLVPTLLVFLALWPAWAAIASPAPAGPLDVIALAVAAGATILEALADRQLQAFRLRERRPDAVIDEGLWRWSRHPNYLGEILFWWGLWLFAVAAGPEHTFTCAGAVAILLLFRFVSIPMMERRLLERRPAYRGVIERTPMLLPWWPGPRQEPAAEPAPPAPAHDAVVDEKARLMLDTMPYVPPPEERGEA